MDLGKPGEDGRAGGRLERELEVFETIVRGKRKGYRDKVKARESGVSAVDGPGEDGDDEGRGEPDKKRARRMSEDDGDEELLDAQLNGAAPTTETLHGLDIPVNGAHTAEYNDETEDDPEIEDEDDEDDAPDDEDEEPEQNDEDEDRIDVDGEEGGGRGRLVLTPNGRAELGSEDESD